MVWPILVESIIFIALAWWAIRTAVFAVSGVAACALVLLAVAFGRDWVWGVLVLLYFGGTIIGTLYGAGPKASTFNRLLGRAMIDWRTVLSRLGWGCLLVVLARSSRYNTVAISAFVGVLAVALGDTEASEIGALSRTRPKRLTSGQPVAAGTPGAVSMLGLLSAVGSGWLVGFTALACYFIIGLTDRSSWTNALYWLPVGATLGSLAGVVVDSLLGGTAQGAFYCEHCQQYSEEMIHTCGLPAKQTSGWRWLTNQGVDLVSSLVGGAVTVSVVLLARLSL